MAVVVDDVTVMTPVKWCYVNVLT